MQWTDEAVWAYFAKVSDSALKASIGMLGSLQGRDSLERALRHPREVPFQSEPKSPCLPFFYAFLAVVWCFLFVSTAEVSLYPPRWKMSNRVVIHGWLLVSAVCATHCLWPTDLTLIPEYEKKLQKVWLPLGSHFLRTCPGHIAYQNLLEILRSARQLGESTDLSSCADALAAALKVSNTMWEVVGGCYADDIGDHWRNIDVQSFLSHSMSQPQQLHKVLRSQKGVKSRGWFGGKVLVLRNGTICCLFDISCALQNNFLANFIFLPLILKVSETDNR